MQLHASCVAFGGKGILIRGASGSGKSTLALALLAIGADLVADDRTDIAVREGWPVASPPAALEGLIEVRGLGLLRADAKAPARLVVVIDLDQTETARLPEPKTITLGGQSLPLLHKIESAHFAAALRQYVLCGKANL